MSALAVRSPTVAIDWSATDGGLWVAHVGPMHLGRVDSDERTRFHAYSAYGASLGSYPDLVAAQRAVERQRTHRRRVAGTRVLVLATALAGAAAMAIAVYAVLATL